ncbi:HD-GYP domain-containing protein [Ktedonobacter racemifer]|uniref:HD-GYP domain-containing protein n=1 Tax=Ktedonobacter racemifer TaxID=363277 RepID=UPI0002D257E2|nr:HD domain-containing phosphohydrolase [Ktedonobacter racemifer]
MILEKIAIPSALLNKPGSLSEQEWIIMRLHPIIGARMLEKAGGIWPSIAPFVLAHHERWDGHGYPYGLVGKAIPLQARILAVVDSCTAMAEQRPYRPALSSAEARVEIQRCAGSAYDPQVAEVFLTLLSQSGGQELTNSSLAIR